MRPALTDLGIEYGFDKLKDADVPMPWGQQLFDAAPAPKTFVALPRGGHANLAAFGLIGVMKDFLGKPVQ